MAGQIQHMFVLMLENRSFDHMLGFSRLTGADAASGQPTTIDGLTDSETNAAGGHPCPVTQPADLVMPLDPAHEFDNVLRQLCGAGATYRPGGAYPKVDNSGFAADYASVGGQAAPGEIMKCYAPGVRARRKI